MKIYTKKGDKGQTDLIGERTQKTSVRIEAIGNVDETNGFIQLAVANTTHKEAILDLNKISKKLFDVGRDLALKLDLEYKVKEEDYQWLEQRIDYYTAQLEPLHDFILPGGANGAANLHVARSVSRRAERRILALSELEEVNNNVLVYFNRLSDFLFTLARVVDKK